MNIQTHLDTLALSGNLRSIPDGSSTPDVLDFSTNDYLGIIAEGELQREFMADADNRRFALSSTASRLLASDQRQYSLLEKRLEELYGRKALLFNSGYHANAGIVSALARKGTLIVADKLVHASIIDGIVLSRAKFTRFAHNDIDALEKIIIDAPDDYDTILVIVESVYSMDGDTPDLDRLCELKRRHRRVMLYVDEAHAVGVCGRSGLGLCVDRHEVDIIIGTMGKALASMGAFALTSDTVRHYLLNTARSFIFSTALAPMQAAWSRHVIDHVIKMDDRREHLAQLSRLLDIEPGSTGVSSHIIPFIVGDAHKVVEMSRAMAADDNVKVLPIRRPTVAEGTERLRISLSATHTADDITRLVNSIKRHS